jgi:HPt (histidine-containing phosphotransfer) domain-containing protein
LDTGINASKSTPNTWLLPKSGAKPVAVSGTREETGCASVWSLTAQLKEIVDSDSAMMQELISLFLDDSAKRLQTLNSANAVRDFKIVRAQAHSLKGSALQMGAAGLAALCATLELSDRPERCGTMVQAIGDEFIRVSQAMEDYLVKAETDEPPPESLAKDVK